MTTTTVEVDDFGGGGAALADDTEALIEVAQAMIASTAPGAPTLSADAAIRAFVEFSLARGPAPRRLAGDPWHASGAAAILRRHTVRRGVKIEAL